GVCGSGTFGGAGSCGGPGGAGSCGRLGGVGRPGAGGTGTLGADGSSGSPGTPSGGTHTVWPATGIVTQVWSAFWAARAWAPNGAPAIRTPPRTTASFRTGRPSLRL